MWSAGSFILFLIILTALLGSLVSIMLFHSLTWLIFIRMLMICLNLWLLITLIFSYTLLIAVYSRIGFKAGNAGAAITFFFYLLFFLGELWKAISFTRPFNIFTYYEPQKLMFGQGHFLRDILVLASLIIIFLMITLKRFNDRDIP